MRSRKRGYLFVSGLIFSLAWANTGLAQDNLQSNWTDSVDFVDDEPPVEEQQAYPPFDGKASGELKEVLAGKKYRFCNDPKYRLTHEQKAHLCKNRPDLAEMCPALTKACKAPAVDKDEKKLKDKESKDLKIPGSSVLGPLAHILFWSLLFGGFAYLLYVVVRSSQGSFEPVIEPKVPRTKPRVTYDAESLPEDLPLSRLLAAAQTHLSEGRLQPGLLYLYRATLQALSERGWIRPRRSKTTGDYARAMRSGKELAEKTQPPSAQETDDAILLLRELERERFVSAPDRERTERLLARTKELVMRLGAVGGLLLCLVLSACQSQTEQHENPLSPSGPRGYALFEEFLGKTATKVQRRYLAPDRPTDEVGVVVSLASELATKDWETLADWVSDGGILVIIDPDSSFAEAFELDLPVRTCNGTPTAGDKKVHLAPPLQRFDIQTPTQQQLLACDDKTMFYDSDWGDGWLLVVSDANLVSNANFASPYVHHIIDDWVRDNQVEFMGPWTGKGADTPIQSLISGEFAWWAAHILLFFAVMAWGLGRRFGTPKDPTKVTRRAFSEHAIAQARLYQSAHSSGWALARYGEWLSEQLRRNGPRGAQERAALEGLLRETQIAADSALNNSKLESQHVHIFRSLLLKLRTKTGRTLPSAKETQH